MFLMDFLHFWEILGIFGAQILGGSWRWITNSYLYKPGLSEAMEDSQRRFMLKGSQAKAIFMQGSY
jgi:hypothetical protein